MDNVLVFIELIAPVFLGILLIIYQLFIHKSDPATIKLDLPIFGSIVKVENTVRNILLIRTLLILFSITLFSVPAFKDYSGFFPKHYKMEVFFDNTGTERALSNFTEKELSNLKIKENWRPYKMNYLRKLNKKVQGKFRVPFRFDDERGIVHSKGETIFEVKKIKGWQKYHIVNASGLLHHILEIPGEKKVTFDSEFDLLETDSNRIDVSIADIYLRFTKVLSPEFKQIIRLSPSEILYDHKLIAPVKVRFFPVIDVGKTVYLVEDKSTSEFIPIGYAIYTPY